MSGHRYRAVGTARASGYGQRALVEDRKTGETMSVYFRLGRWRLYRNDDPAPRSVAAVARRALGGER